METTIEINLLRALALMQHNEEPFFIWKDRAFTGNHDELHREWIEATENLPDAQTWDEFIADNCTEVEELDPDEFYENDYYVLTDEEADEKAKEYIEQSLWAFNASFLAEETGFDPEIFEAIQSNGKCESNNDVIENTIIKTCGIDAFVDAAISADGRGHFLSSYDGHENEETVEDQTFYIYRIN